MGAYALKLENSYVLGRKKMRNAKGTPHRKLQSILRNSSFTLHPGERFEVLQHQSLHISRGEIEWLRFLPLN